VKKYSIALFLCLAIISTASAGGPMVLQIAGSGVVAGGGSAYCVGGEPFCFDGTSDGQITWTSTPAAEDCDGYDTDLDWCDYDVDIPSGTGYANIHSLGVMGDGATSFVQYNMSSSYSEFYLELWFNPVEDITSIDGFDFLKSDDSTIDVRVIFRSDSTARVYYNNLGGYFGTVAAVLTDVDTWIHFGLYYKEGTGDGIVRMWVNSGGNFGAGDIVINEAAVTTGTIAVQNLRFGGPVAAKVQKEALIKLTAGAPSWAFE